MLVGEPSTRWTTSEIGACLGAVREDLVACLPPGTSRTSILVSFATDGVVALDHAPERIGPSAVECLRARLATEHMSRGAADRTVALMRLVD